MPCKIVFIIFNSHLSVNNLSKRNKEKKGNVLAKKMINKNSASIVAKKEYEVEQEKKKKEDKQGKPVNTD